MGIFEEYEGMDSEKCSVEEVEAAAKFLVDNDVMTEEDFDYIKWLGFKNFYWTDLIGEFVCSHRLGDGSFIEHLSFDEIKKRVQNL